MSATEPLSARREEKTNEEGKSNSLGKMFQKMRMSSDEKKEKKEQRTKTAVANTNNNNNKGIQKYVSTWPIFCWTRSQVAATAATTIELKSDQSFEEIEIGGDENLQILATTAPGDGNQPPSSPLSSMAAAENAFESIINKTEIYD